MVNKGVIKSVLREELERSLRMQRNYERELEKLPKGSLVLKKINGKKYYYLIFRADKRVKFIYRGNKVSEEEIIQYKEAKEMRKKYRNLLSRVKKQIKFLQGTLRGKESI